MNQRTCLFCTKEIDGRKEKYCDEKCRAYWYSRNWINKKYDSYRVVKIVEVPGIPVSLNGEVEVHVGGTD